MQLSRWFREKFHIFTDRIIQLIHHKGKSSRYFFFHYSLFQTHTKRDFSRHSPIGKLSRIVCKNVLFATVERLDGAKLARICITTRETISYGRRIVYGITAAFVHLAIYPHEYKQHFSTAMRFIRNLHKSIISSRKRFCFHRRKIPWRIIEFDGFAMDSSFSISVES